MNTMDTLTFGLAQDNGKDALAAWGARAIWYYRDNYMDYVHDRISMVGDDVSKSRLLNILNNSKCPNLNLVSEILLANGHDPSSSDIVTIYEDDAVLFRASAQASHGYVYMTARLKD